LSWSEIKHFLQTFEILDQDRTGKINFRQFLHGFALLHEQATVDVKCVLAASVYDFGNTGKVSKDEVKSIVTQSCSMGFLQTNKASEQVSNPELSDRSSVLTPTAFWAQDPKTDPSVIVNAEVDYLFAEYGNSGTMTADQLSTALKSEQYNRVLEAPLFLVKQTILSAPVLTKKKEDKKQKG
jgi:hypothetical protein